MEDKFFFLVHYNVSHNETYLINRGFLIPVKRIVRYVRNLVNVVSQAGH
jgi:hypothetical protein